MEFVPSRTTAAHEAAHAVVGQLLGLRVEIVSIVPDDQDGGRLGHVRWASDDGLAPIARSLARITATLAGTLGEEFDGLPRGYLRDDSGWHDRAQAIDDALKLAVLRDGGEGSADEILDRAAWQATEIVEEHRETIERVTDALMARGTLNSDRVETLLAGAPVWFLGSADDWRAFEAGKRGKRAPRQRTTRTVLARSPYPREYLIRGLSAHHIRLAPVRPTDVHSEPGQAALEPSLRHLDAIIGHMAVFNIWTEISSAYEGNFLERLTPGAFAASLGSGRTVRCLFQHGRDPYIGMKPLGPFSELREDEIGLFYEVPLLDTDYNAQLVPGLQHDVYGASFVFSLMREEFVEDPGPSDYNPKGLPERTIKEVELFEGGPVTFGAYPEATAGMRSLTDEFRALDERQVSNREAA